MKEKMLYKTLAVAVILLFIGLGVQPAFAEVSFKSDNSELIEVTIKICRPCKIEEYTLLLTQEQVEKLDNEFDDFKIKLDNALTKSETIDVYNDMLVSLDRLGMIPDYISVYEAQQLVTGRNYLISDNELPSKLFENSNFLCLISGEVSSNFGFLLSKWAFFYYIPFRIGGMMYFGTYYKTFQGGSYYYQNSNGWVKTVGLLGKKEWISKFRGAIFDFPIDIWFPDYLKMGCFGIVGFTGFAIETTWDVYFIGFAPWVKIKNV